MCAPLHPQAKIAMSEDLIREQLDLVLKSKIFDGACRHQRLLTYLADQAFAHPHERVKEATLALDVFDRSASTFDPDHDTIVRVEMRRLRERLGRYYDDEGATSSIEMRLPLGVYVLQFLVRNI